MPAILPFQNGCCTPCEDLLPSSIPGADGDDGAAGTDGAPGKNSFTFTIASYTQPAVGTDVVVDVIDSSWAVVGQEVFVQVGGHYTVIAKTTTSKMTLRNVGFDDNAGVGIVVTNGKQVGPAGHTGTTGGFSGPFTLGGVSLAADGRLLLQWRIADGGNDLFYEIKFYSDPVGGARIFGQSDTGETGAVGAGAPFTAGGVRLTADGRLLLKWQMADGGDGLFYEIKFYSDPVSGARIFGQSDTGEA